MAEFAPATVRHAARLIVLDPDERVLLFSAHTPKRDRSFWIMPGGGLRDGEDHVAAARRELLEETGIHGEPGPCVWTRRHVFPWGDRRLDQRERYFVTRVDGVHVEPVRPDDYIDGHRWWTLAEIEASDETFAPRGLAGLLPPILRGDYPDPPIDCGV